MALSAEAAKKYGLTKSDATSSDYDKGIVGYKGTYYSIDGFEHQQKDDADTDQGAVFKSSLYDDAKAKGFSVSNFNTANDVEGALQALGKSGKTAPTPEPKEKEPIVHSKRLANARAIDAQPYNSTKDLYGGSTDPANSFLNRYKLKLGERLATGYYVNKQKSLPNNVNSSRVGSGSNGVSVDAAYYAKTGRDNRIDDPRTAALIGANVLL